MTVKDAILGARLVFLDSAPAIYVVERHSEYVSRVDPLFECLNRGELSAAITPITLAECLVVPIREGDAPLCEAFASVFEPSRVIRVVDLTTDLARVAAELRARHKLHLLDAFQIAAALHCGADLFLTNDKIFRRVTEIKVVLIDDLEEVAPEPIVPPVEEQ